MYKCIRRDCKFSIEKKFDRSKILAATSDKNSFAYTDKLINRLIDWCGAEVNFRSKQTLQQFETQSFDYIFTMFHSYRFSLSLLRENIYN